MLTDEEMIKVMRKSKELGIISLVHAENGDLIEECTKKIKSWGITGPEGHLYSRPETFETDATQRAITIAEELNSPAFIVHVNSKNSALAVSNAKRRGCVVYGEALPAALATDGSNYFHKCWRHSAGHVMSPPLRDDATYPAHLMELLANGDLELTGSDHCTFSTNQKALGKDDFSKIPNGVNGTEERMCVVWDRGVNAGKMDPCRFVAVTSTNAAKVFNIYPRKGLIARGSDADVVVWDPEAVKSFSAATHNCACDFNVFEGMKFKGAPSVVIASGNVVFQNGVLNVVQGSGRLIERQPFCDYVYSRIKVRDTLRPKRVEREPYTGGIFFFLFNY
jgi:dihydropyrimidinase